MTEQASHASDPAPKVEGPIGNSAVGIGYAIGKLARALSGDNGLRMLALSVVASFTFVTAWSVTKYIEMQSGLDSTLIRTGEDRVEREKADSARRDRERSDEFNRRENDNRNWLSIEREKDRAAHKDNILFLTREFASEQEKNRGMVYKLATEPRPRVGGMPDLP